MHTAIIVDDERIVRSSIQCFMEKNAPAFRVAGCFSDGTHALQFLSGTSVDLVITDIRMIQMSGLALSAEIRRRWPDTHIVIISGYSDFEYARQAIQYGVQSYILKPIDFDELARCLAMVDEKLKKGALRQNDAAQENAELYLYYLLSGLFQTKDDIYLAQNHLSLPFLLERGAACVFDCMVTDEKAVRDYGKEALSVDIKTALGEEITDFWLYFVARKDNHHYFLAISESRSAIMDLCKLQNAIGRRLDLPCAILSVLRADNLLALARTAQGHWFSHMLRQAMHRMEVDGASYRAHPVDERKTAEGQPLAEKIKQYVDLNYMRDISREDVAGAVYISPAYLSRLFKAHCGMSFIEYLTQARIGNAVKLMASNLRISEIGEMVGYRNRNTFLVNFRQYTSFTPSEYRQKVLNLEGSGDETD